MACVKLGVLVAGLAGSVGGGTFQRDAQGTQLRTKPLPILRRSEHTPTNRATTSYLSRQWAALTNDQRSNWDYEASLLTWYNTFGDVITGQGYWLYLRCNQNLAYMGLPFISDPLPPPAFEAYSDLACTYDPSPKLELTWSTPAAVQTDTRLCVFATPRISLGRSQQFGQTRFIASYDPGTTSGLDLYPDWFTRFGQTTAVPALVILTVIPVDSIGGHAGPRYLVKALPP